MVRGLFGGAVLAGLFGWAPLSQNWAALATMQAAYNAWIDTVGMWLLSLP